jgi:phosphoribosyl-ATP pyrophosphohydrolase
MFTLVEIWMSKFGVPMHRDRKTCSLYSKLIQEELKELEAEFKHGRSEAELKEAIDLLWVTMAKILALGYSYDDVRKAMTAVYNSNMSKASASKEQVEKYIEDNMLEGYTVQQVDDLFLLLNRSGKIQKGPNYHVAKIKLDK